MRFSPSQLRWSDFMWFVLFTVSKWKNRSESHVSNSFLVPFACSLNIASVRNHEQMPITIINKGFCSLSLVIMKWGTVDWMTNIEKVTNQIPEESWMGRIYLSAKVYRTSLMFKSPAHPQRWFQSFWPIRPLLTLKVDGAMMCYMRPLRILIRMINDNLSRS